MTADPATLPVVRLKIERRSSHPWVFQKMVEKPSTRVPNGAVVDVLDRDGKWVGRGLYNAHSRITLRILTDDVTDAYRVVHSEADGLSGLIIDRFGSTLVMEFFSAGMYRQRESIQAALL